MCSNTTKSGSYGDLQKEDHYYNGSCLKKQKKDRVRRRGPGVAELEKIRLQQENKSTLLSSSSGFARSLFLPPPLFPPPSETSPFTTTRSVLKSPPTTATEKLPSPVFPFFADGSLIPPAKVFQRKQQHSSSSSIHHHHTMNLSNPSPRRGEFYQFIELPSNQRSCLGNDEKIASKRPPPWHLQRDTMATTSLRPISKELKQNRTMDMKLITPVQDSGSTICNPITIDSPTTTTTTTSIRSFPSNYPRFIPLSSQYQQQQKELDEDMQWRSKKLSDREQRACEPYEPASDHGIDLSLKL